MRSRLQRTTYCRAFGAFILLLGIAGQASAGSITYAIQNYPLDQDGAVLSGVIVTNGVIGTLTASDILSWAWTIIPPGGSAVTVSSSDAGSSLSLQNLVIASQAGITIAEPSTPESSSVLAFQGAGGAVLEYERSSAGNAYLGIVPGRLVWTNYSPIMGGYDPWIVATAVPEPPTITMAGFATFLGLGIWARRRPLVIRDVSP